MQIECFQVVGRVLHLSGKNTDSGWRPMVFSVVDRRVPPHWLKLSDMDRRSKDEAEDERSC